MSQELIRGLLGHGKEAIDALLGGTPSQVVPDGKGGEVYRFESGAVKEIRIDPAGRITRCNYTEERRGIVRVRPAHLVLVEVDSVDDTYSGMLLDLSAVSARVRLKGNPDFKRGDVVYLRFVLPVCGEFFNFRVSAEVFRTETRDGAYRAVFLFDEVPQEELLFHKYITCRCSEAVFQQKNCVQFGGKCKADCAADFFGSKG